MSETDRYIFKNFPPSSEWMQWDFPWEGLSYIYHSEQSFKWNSYIFIYSKFWMLKRFNCIFTKTFSGWIEKTLEIVCSIRSNQLIENSALCTIVARWSPYTSVMSEFSSLTPIGVHPVNKMTDIEGSKIRVFHDVTRYPRWALESAFLNGFGNYY